MLLMRRSNRDRCLPRPGTSALLPDFSGASLSPIVRTGKAGYFFAGGPFGSASVFFGGAASRARVS
jgi:hypothetical protein